MEASRSSAWAGELAGVSLCRSKSRSPGHCKRWIVASLSGAPDSRLRSPGTAFIGDHVPGSNAVTTGFPSSSPRSSIFFSRVPAVLQDGKARMRWAGKGRGSVPGWFRVRERTRSQVDCDGTAMDGTVAQRVAKGTLALRTSDAHV